MLDVGNLSSEEDPLPGNENIFNLSETKDEDGDQYVDDCVCS